MNSPELKLHIRWKDFQKDAQVEEYLKSKLVKLLDFHFVNANEIIKSEIVYYDKSNTYKVSVSVEIKGKPRLYAESSINNNLQQAINEVIDKAVDQLRRIKTQLTSRF